MYLIQCVNAYMAVNAMKEKEWDYKTAYTLAKLKRELQPQIEFFTQEERKLIEECGEKNEKGQTIFTEHGTFRFKDADSAEKYNKKRLELGMVPVELQWEKQTLPPPEKIAPVHLEALEGFIEFGGEA